MAIGDPIFVLNGGSYFRAVSQLGTSHTDIKDFIKNPKAFQFVLFTGGEDISPKLYGDTSPKGYCMFNSFRDVIEKHIYNIARKNNVKMIGICRGLQFLTAMAGGKLIHHVADHSGYDHQMILTSPWQEKQTIIVNSYHHQMCLPTKDGIVLGHAPKNIADNIYFGDKDKEMEWKGVDVEAMYLPNIGAFGVQWHPEMLNKESDGYRWFNFMVDSFVNNKKEFLDYIETSKQAGVGV